ncbi:MAG TPA: aldehyde ferredoxin oxidoreductase C-terminal domain-containing protein, partial [Desulfobacterales bacterium]|nr:aldehyde ferredoxin oxidoreductase C-terminal domain-containing protein [Desulfobacterales bacterium]
GDVHSLLKGRGSTAVIGPAAENGVLFSSAIIDGHYAAGRSGIGLTFAFKNLKYITIRGTGKTKAFDPEGLSSAREDIFRLTAASPILLGKFGISRFGTGALYDLMDARHMMPTENFRRTQFDQAFKMNAHAFKRKFKPRNTGCRGCHILCKKITKDQTSMPEFETMSHFSALLDNTDIGAVVKANRICNEMGMDTISAAATLACFSEISKKKLSPKAIVSLLMDIGKKKGVGAELGKGAARYAENCGRSDLAMVVKGQELPAYDPRGAFGMALAYATSSRGACHLRAYPISHEILRKPIATNRFSFSGKARMIKIGEDLNAVADSLTACKFIFFAASLEEYAKIYTAVTGIKTSGQDLFEVGERICYNERMMNAANGFTEKDDDLPARFFSMPGYTNESINIKPIDKEAFLTARSSYYIARKLNKDGTPILKVAKELGLKPI